MHSSVYIKNCERHSIYFKSRKIVSQQPIDASVALVFAFDCIKEQCFLNS